MLGSVGKHTPRILRKQLIHQLCEQYKNSIKNKGEETKSNFSEPGTGMSCSPSIERFDGALLFIDISGFTLLSQQLNVEDLKNQINDYFTKMLDIVDRHGGDVVKFAGDALYIAWYNSNIANSSHALVSMAVDCGMEIISACSNQKIDFSLLSGEKHLQNRFMRQLLPTLNALFGQTKTAASNTTTPTIEHHSENAAYLNVHAGISVGQMAGVDIGVGDRWE
jgi:class 3 adenylate cyclase